MTIAKDRYREFQVRCPNPYAHALTSRVRSRIQRTCIFGAVMTQTKGIYNVHVISGSPSITMNNQSGVALGNPGKVSTAASRVIVTPLTSNISLSQPPRQTQRQLIGKVLTSEMHGIVGRA